MTLYRRNPEPRPLLKLTVWTKPGDLPDALVERWPQLVLSKDKKHYWLSVEPVRTATEWMPISDTFDGGQWDNVVVPFNSPLHQEEEGERVDINKALDQASAMFRLIIKHLAYWELPLRDVDVQLAYLRPWASIGSKFVMPGNLVLTNVETGKVADVLANYEELNRKYGKEEQPGVAGEELRDVRVGVAGEELRDVRVGVGDQPARPSDEGVQAPPSDADAGADAP